MFIRLDLLSVSSGLTRGASLPFEITNKKSGARTDVSSSNFCTITGRPMPRPRRTRLVSSRPAAERTRLWQPRVWYLLGFRELVFGDVPRILMPFKGNLTLLPDGDWVLEIPATCLLIILEIYVFVFTWLFLNCYYLQCMLWFFQSVSAKGVKEMISVFQNSFNSAHAWPVSLVCSELFIHCPESLLDCSEVRVCAGDLHPRAASRHPWPWLSLQQERGCRVSETLTPPICLSR